MLRFARAAKPRLNSWIHRVRQATHRFALRRYDLLLVTEGQSWYLDDFSQQIVAHLSPEWRGCAITFVPHQIKGRVIHFVERYRFMRAGDVDRICAKNQVILTWWHGGAHPVGNVHVDDLIRRVSSLAFEPILFHITSSLYLDVLLNLGIPVQKIVRVPMGIDLSRFRMTEPDRATYKARLGIPGDKVCIGYFQRDGDEEPKLVKGPDVFIDVIGDLWIKRRDLFVLLAGPKRGYVMHNLDRLGVPYKYLGWVPFTEMAPCYYASDLYLITSREEGGPAAVLECMATGTPLVSTRVGMAVDVIHHGWNGFLADIEDRDALVSHTSSLLDDPGLRARLSAHALQTAVDYDWSRVAADYSRLLYADVGRGQESGHDYRDNLHPD